MKQTFFSVVIPTRNSGVFLDTCLRSICYPKRYDVEVIVADNGSTDDTRTYAKAYGARVVNVRGKAPQVALQRNEGARYSCGTYIIFLDHDMELSKDFFRSARQILSQNPTVDAWYIPEHILASNRLMSAMRTFENDIYNDTFVCAVRIIKRSKYLQTKGYDSLLSHGPADWDFDNSLRLSGCRLKTLPLFLYHHEERLAFWDYVRKKKKYQTGIQLYREKWKQINADVYKMIISKQLNPWYRLFWIFYEKGKWKKTFANFHLYISFLITRCVMLFVYYQLS